MLFVNQPSSWKSIGARGYFKAIFLPTSTPLGRSGLVGEGASSLWLWKQPQREFLEGQADPQEAPKIRYCLYARKSTEEEDKQALSIESQVREMTAIAVRESLEIVEVKRESHSSKEVGQR